MMLPPVLTRHPAGSGKIVKKRGKSPAGFDIHCHYLTHGGGATVARYNPAQFRFPRQCFPTTSRASEREASMTPPAA